MRPWIGLYFIMFFGGSLGYSQTISVKDAQTNVPLEHVHIQVNNGSPIQLTNLRGEIVLKNLQERDSIYISRMGYIPKRLAASILRMDSSILLQSVLLTDEIIVTAARWQKSKSEVPEKISVIDKEEIAFQSPQTAADLLGVSGEVFIQKSQLGGGSPMIRGFATNRLLYTIDGIRMNTAIFRAGNIQNVISLDPFAIEGVEVLFGPGSVPYGSDAIGGVMNFRTMNPSFASDKPIEVNGGANVRYSTANQEKTGHFDFSISGKNWAALTSVSSHNFNNLRMGSHGPKDYLRTFYVTRMDSIDRIVANEDPHVQNPTGYQQINLMQKIRFSPKPQWDIQYGFHFSETTNYSRYDRLSETSIDKKPVFAVWDYGPQKWQMNHLEISHLNNFLLFDKMTIRMAHQFFEESRIDRRFNHHRLRTQVEQVNAWSLNADFKKTMGTQDVEYGLEAIRNDVLSRSSAVNILNGTPMQVADRYPQSNWQSYAAFANYQVKLSNKHLLQAGLRYNLFSIQSNFKRSLEFYPFDFEQVQLQNAAVTGNLAYIYRPSTDCTIRAILANGFRAPNVDDMGKIFDFQVGEVVVPNYNLKPEYAYNAEVGIVKAFNDRLRLEFTAYYTLLQNAMVRRPISINGSDSIMFDGSMAKTFAVQNAAHATVFGFHSGFELKILPQLSLNSKVNYQRGKEEMDNGDISPSRHAAPWFGISRLTFKKDKVDIQLYSVYTGAVLYKNLNEEERNKTFLYAKDENGNPFSPAWFTINLKTQYYFSEKLWLSVGIENIGDLRYQPYSSGIAAPGRNVIMSIRANI